MPTPPSSHLSGRLQAVYDAFYDDAHKKRAIKAADKEKRMIGMSRLMDEPATAENAKLTDEEAVALVNAVQAQMKRACGREGAQ